MNPLLRLGELDQSIWLDTIRRRMITSGRLKRLIEDDGLQGMTSNPSIFEKAIGGTEDYEADIRAMAAAGKTAAEVYEKLSIDDVRSAADAFRPLYDASHGQHGFVSLEVNPHLAHDTEKTVAEARRLWGALDRPNVFIKVPGTQEGLPAIRQLIGEGMNVNVTLLFGLPRYAEVVDAYMAGLEDRAGRGEPLTHVRSVASFFLSRIDVLVDRLLEKKMDDGGPKVDLARKLHGQVAIASAKVAYQIYLERIQGSRWTKLAEKGAAVQRLLWASTSTKNPAYSDVKYVEPLIGKDTINTVPMETLQAYRDHGRPEARLTNGVDGAREVLARLPEIGIDLDAVTRQLEAEGVEKFNKPFDALMKTLAQEIDAARRGAAHR